MLNPEYHDYFMFTTHVVLLTVKLWTLYSFTQLLVFHEAPSTKKYMLVFKPYEALIIIVNLLVVIFEIYFFFNFFEDIELYYYEDISVIDQILSGALVALYLKEEGRTDGKR